jgi:hypothetical protein
MSNTQESSVQTENTLGTLNEWSDNESGENYRYIFKSNAAAKREQELHAHQLEVIEKARAAAKKAAVREKARTAATEKAEARAKARKAAAEARAKAREKARKAAAERELQKATSIAIAQSLLSYQRECKKTQNALKNESLVSTPRCCSRDPDAPSEEHVDLFKIGRSTKRGDPLDSFKKTFQNNSKSDNTIARLEQELHAFQLEVLQKASETKARLAAEKEEAQLAAEKEEARLAAEKEEARLAAEKEEARAKAQAAAAEARAKARKAATEARAKAQVAAEKANRKGLLETALSKLEQRASGYGQNEIFKVQMFLHLLILISINPHFVDTAKWIGRCLYVIYMETLFLLEKLKKGEKSPETWRRLLFLAGVLLREILLQHVHGFYLAEEIHFYGTKRSFIKKLHALWIKNREKAIDKIVSLLQYSERILFRELLAKNPSIGWKEIMFFLKEHLSEFPSNLSGRFIRKESFLKNSRFICVCAGPSKSQNQENGTHTRGFSNLHTEHTKCGRCARGGCGGRGGLGGRCGRGGHCNPSRRGCRKCDSCGGFGLVPKRTNQKKKNKNNKNLRCTHRLELNGGSALIERESKGSYRIHKGIRLVDLVKIVLNKGELELTEFSRMKELLFRLTGLLDEDSSNYDEECPIGILNSVFAVGILLRIFIKKNMDPAKWWDSQISLNSLWNHFSGNFESFQKEHLRLWHREMVYSLSEELFDTLIFKNSELINSRIKHLLSNPDLPQSIRNCLSNFGETEKKSDSLWDYRSYIDSAPEKKSPIEMLPLALKMLDEVRSYLSNHTQKQQLLKIRIRVGSLVLLGRNEFNEDLETYILSVIELVEEFVRIIR